MKKEITSCEDVKTYEDFVEFYNLNMVLCNDIISATGSENWELESGEFFDYYDENGDYITREEYEDGINEHDYEERPREIYQWYIISNSDAQLIMDIVDDDPIIMYNDDLDLYVWGIDHWGTPWDGVPISLHFSWDDNEQAV